MLIRSKIIEKLIEKPYFFYKTITITITITLQKKFTITNTITITKRQSITCIRLGNRHDYTTLASLASLMQ
jgi:hypothetical protein